MTDGVLSFLGRGSAFADQHNCAFFVQNHELILLDCPVTAFQKMKYFDFSEISRIYILVTHTHGDHAGGIGMMIQYAWFMKNKLSVTVIAPSKAVQKDLKHLLRKIEGCDKHWFTLMTAKKLKKSWLIAPIATKHVKALDQKCFGWCLNVNQQNVVYTGDTATLKPYLKYLDEDSILYTEISAFDTHVHLYIDEYLPELIRLTQKGIQVRLMHMDDEKQIADKIRGTEIVFSPLYEEKSV